MRTGERLAGLMPKAGFPVGGEDLIRLRLLSGDGPWLVEKVSVLCGDLKAQLFQLALQVSVELDQVGFVAAIP